MHMCQVAAAVQSSTARQQDIMAESATVACENTKMIV